MNQNGLVVRGAIAAGVYGEEVPLRSAFEWTLRIGAFIRFVGHGVFGIITKEAWVPYFGVAGIGRADAFTLMPVVGTVDVIMGCLMLICPRPDVVY